MRMQVHRWISEDGGDAVVRFDDARWLLELRRIEVHGTSGPRRSPAGEGLLVVLSGTHDLFAGGGSWARRGRRASPLDAERPVAVFLPPSTPYHTEHGNGALLVVAARQPEPPKASSAREELSRKPLLQMSGSGKAFDPMSGAWKPQEAFLSSPEAILPRRLEQIHSPSGAVIERVIAGDYKALGLCVDEVRLAPGQCAAPPAVPGTAPDYPVEVAVYVETEGVARVGDVTVGSAEAPVVVSVAGPVAPRIEAVSGRAYALFAYCGTKGST